ncbi:MAG: nitrate reductase molybdenum cofactor assembly chaperone [Armatimonadota bacterium]
MTVMAPIQHRYEQLAALLEYPTEETAAVAAGCREHLRVVCPPAAPLLDGLHAYLGENPLTTAEERYTHTFELKPVCALDIGYHVFGEDCQRGAFLALLRERQERAGLTGEVELPDYLPVVLRWLALVEGTEEYRDMIQECVLPSLAKMDESLADTDNPYRDVLRAVAAVLAQDLRSEVEGSEAGAEGSSWSG